MGARVRCETEDPRALVAPTDVDRGSPAPSRWYARSREVPVRHWILMFRPETYAAARQHGLMAVLHNHRRRFGEVQSGDRFVAYVSRQRILDAHGEIVGEPFQEVSDVPVGWTRYTERARIRFDETDAGIDAKELLWGLSICCEGIKTAPTNLLLCKGGFMEISEADYNWLRAVLRGEAPPDPRRE